MKLLKYPWIVQVRSFEYIVRWHPPLSLKKPNFYLSSTSISEFYLFFLKIMFCRLNEITKLLLIFNKDIKLPKYTYQFEILSFRPLKYIKILILRFF